MPNIYLDHVSTTKPYKEIVETYTDLLNKNFYNSDALYEEGVNLFLLQEKSREAIAKLLNTRKEDITFTSGASESNNTVIKGLAFKNKDKKHIITSSYEHSSITNTLKQMEEVFGYEVTYLKPDETGSINPNDLKDVLREDTLLVTIMHINNEAGCINDINELARVTKENSKAYFHSDITQSLGKLDIDLSNIDLASCSAHKIHGLKGSGLLIKKNHIEIEPLITAGQQERGIRGGTSNALVNILFAKTLRLALENKTKYHNDLHNLMVYLESELKKIEDVKIVSPTKHTDSLITIQTRLTSEVMSNAFDKVGIKLSSVSTCGTRSEERSHTAMSLGYDEKHVIRVSLDYANTKEEVDYFLKTLKNILENY